jgi:hypothetical protein
MKSAKIEIRVEEQDKAEIAKRAKAAGKTLSAYLLDRALSDGDADLKDSQAKAERVAGSTGGSAPVAEQPETREQFIERRAKQLHGQGKTMRRAKSEARAEWTDREDVQL